MDENTHENCTGGMEEVEKNHQEIESSTSSTSSASSTYSASSASSAISALSISDEASRKVMRAFDRTIRIVPLRKAIFTFARSAWTAAKAQNAPPGIFRPVVRLWFAEIRKRMAAKADADGYGITWTADEAYGEFCAAWEKIRTPDDMRERVLEARTVKLPASLPYDDRRLRELLAFCIVLQRHAEPNPFYISCGKAAEVLDISSTTVWRFLKVLITDGFLSVAIPGTDRNATRYRCRVVEDK